MIFKCLFGKIPVIFAVFVLLNGFNSKTFASFPSAYSLSLYGSRTVTVRNISSLSSSGANNLIKIADRSTKTDRPISQTTVKGLMQTNDRILVTNRYIFWFDCSTTDGSGSYTWPGSGILSGIWSLDGGSFKYKVKGPNASSIETSEWAPNEMVRGSSSPNDEDHHWDRYAQNFDILLAEGTSVLCLNWAQGKPDANWAITQDLSEESNTIVWEVSGHPCDGAGNIVFTGTTISFDSKLRFTFTPDSDWFRYKLSLKPSENITLDILSTGVWLAYDCCDTRCDIGYPWGRATHDGFYKGKYKYAYSPQFCTMMDSNYPQPYIVAIPYCGYSIDSYFTQPPYFQLANPACSYTPLLPMEHYINNGLNGGLIEGLHRFDTSRSQPYPGESMLLWSTSRDVGAETSNYPYGIEIKYVRDYDVLLESGERTLGQSHPVVLHEPHDAMLDLYWGGANFYFDSNEWTICELDFRTNIEKYIDAYDVPNFHDAMAGDYEPDGDVDLFDLSYFAQHWLDDDCCIYMGADNSGDGEVNLKDFAGLANNWMTGDYEIPSIAWYKLDEASGTTAEDSSGYNYDGTLISGGSGLPVWQPASGQIEGAVDVNNESHINCGQILDINDNFTIALWFNARKWGQTTGTYNFPGLISKRNLYDGNCEWELFYSPGGGGTAGTRGLQFWFNNKGSQKIFGSAGIDPTLNTWHHVAVVRSGENWALYLDGTCEATQTNTVGIINTTSNVRIGVLGGDVLSQCFEGLIDDVRGYRRALSQGEINDIMNGG